MKDYNEIANDIFERRDQYVAEQRKKRKSLVRITAAACSFALVALIGIRVWRSGWLDSTVPPTINNPGISGEQSLNGDNNPNNPNESTGLSNDNQNQGGQISNPDNIGSQSIDTTGKKLFAINEITGTIGAAFKYRDPELHYKETWDLAKAADYLGVNIPNIIKKIPDGDAEAGFPQIYDFMFIENSGFTFIYENNGTLVEDRMCYAFTGSDNAKIMILTSKLRMPYDCLYSSDTDDVTNICIPTTDEIIPVCVYAQGETEKADYSLYVGDFEYEGVYYRIHIENLAGKYLDTLIREIVK